MNLIHLFSIALLALNFSGKPLPPTSNNNITAKAGPGKTIKKEEAEFIPWTNERLLNWSDFLCEPKRNSDAVASTSTSLGIAYQVENGFLSYHISCNFSKNKSWGLLKTNYILAHEQGHFDITEIFARKLYMALQDYMFNRRTYRNDINDIYNAVVKEKEIMQATYDGESDHSRNRKIQNEWFEKIGQLLDETAAYATYP